MIAKILKSSKSFAAIRYNEEKVKSGLPNCLKRGISQNTSSTFSIV